MSAIDFTSFLATAIYTCDSIRLSHPHSTVNRPNPTAHAGNHTKNPGRFPSSQITRSDSPVKKQVDVWQKCTYCCKNDTEMPWLCSLARIFSRPATRDTYEFR